jgi:hypothetical protein
MIYWSCGAKTFDFFFFLYLPRSNLGELLFPLPASVKPPASDQRGLSRKNKKGGKKEEKKKSLSQLDED